MAAQPIDKLLTIVVERKIEMKLDKNIVMVFDAKKSENRKKTVEANISSYEGRDQDDNPRYSNWRAYFVGDAYKEALTLENQDRIKILEGKIENNYNKESKKLFVTVTIFDFVAEPKESK